MKVGQVWEDCSGRTFAVEWVSWEYALVRTIKDGNFLRRSAIRLNRFASDYRRVA